MIIFKSNTTEEWILNITNCYYSGLESGDIVVENSKPVEQVDSNSGSFSLAITDLASAIASKSKNDYEEMKKEYQVMLCILNNIHVRFTFENVFVSTSCFHLAALLKSSIFQIDRDDEILQSICCGEDSHIPCTFGKLPGNLAKNRFRTTFPCK